MKCNTIKSDSSFFTKKKSQVRKRKVEKPFGFQRISEYCFEPYEKVGASARLMYKA